MLSLGSAHRGVLVASGQRTECCGRDDRGPTSAQRGPGPAWAGWGGPSLPAKPSPSSLTSSPHSCFPLQAKRICLSLPLPSTEGCGSLTCPEMGRQRGQAFWTGSRHWGEGVRSRNLKRQLHPPLPLGQPWPERDPGCCQPGSHDRTRCLHLILELWGPRAFPPPPLLTTARRSACPST